VPTKTLGTLGILWIASAVASEAWGDQTVPVGMMAELTLALSHYHDFGGMNHGNGS
jgi:hypothetical protein